MFWVMSVYIVCLSVHRGVPCDHYPWCIDLYHRATPVQDLVSLCSSHYPLVHGPAPSNLFNLYQTCPHLFDLDLTVEATPLLSRPSLKLFTVNVNVHFQHFMTFTLYSNTLYDIHALQQHTLWHSRFKTFTLYSNTLHNNSCFTTFTLYNIHTLQHSHFMTIHTLWQFTLYDIHTLWQFTLYNIHALRHSHFTATHFITIHALRHSHFTTFTLYDNSHFMTIHTLWYSHFTTNKRNRTSFLQYEFAMWQQSFSQKCPQYKNANIANFLLAVPIEMN